MIFWSSESSCTMRFKANVQVKTAVCESTRRQDTVVFTLILLLTRTS